MNSGSRSGGVGFLGLLALLFIALKLTSQIEWSWWWVLAPLWVPWAVFAFVMAMSATCALILRAIEAPEDRRRRELSESLKSMSRALERNRR